MHSRKNSKPKAAVSLLSVESLSVHYHTRGAVVRALRNISFRLNPGRSLGIIGESGSGKTTLALLGLIQPPHRVRGKVLVEGMDMTALNEGNSCDSVKRA